METQPRAIASAGNGSVKVPLAAPSPVRILARQRENPGDLFPWCSSPQVANLLQVKKESEEQHQPNSSHVFAGWSLGSPGFWKAGRGVLGKPQGLAERDHLNSLLTFFFPVRSFLAENGRPVQMAGRCLQITVIEHSGTSTPSIRKHMQDLVLL